MAKTAEKSKKNKTSDKSKKITARSKAEKIKSDKYTDPRLRSKLKDKIQAGSKGGKKGQWSARKAQLLVKQYEKAGGGYLDTDAAGKRRKSKGKSSADSSGKDSRQKALSAWTREQRQPEDGGPPVSSDTPVSSGNGTTHLPKEARKEPSPSEQEETLEATSGASSNGTVARTGTRKRQPLQGYDAMTIRDILTAMTDANVRSLRTVLRYEKANRNRKTLVPKLEKELAARS